VVAALTHPQAQAFPFLAASIGHQQRYVALPIVFQLLGVSGNNNFEWTPQFSTHALAMRNTPVVRKFVQRWIDNMMLGDGQILLDDSLPHPQTHHHDITPHKRASYIGSRPDQAIMSEGCLVEHSFM
jgi:hypothetical protein